MKYSPELPQDTEPLGRCSGNRMKMPLKCHLRIKCLPHEQIITSIILVLYYINNIILLNIILLTLKNARHFKIVLQINCEGTAQFCYN